MLRGSWRLVKPGGIFFAVSPRRSGWRIGFLDRRAALSAARWLRAIPRGCGFPPRAHGGARGQLRRPVEDHRRPGPALHDGLDPAQAGPLGALDGRRVVSHGGHLQDPGGEDRNRESDRAGNRRPGRARRAAHVQLRVACEHGRLRVRAHRALSRFRCHRAAPPARRSDPRPPARDFPHRRRAGPRRCRPARARGLGAARRTVPAAILRLHAPRSAGVMAARALPSATSTWKRDGRAGGRRARPSSSCTRVSAASRSGATCRIGWPPRPAAAPWSTAAPGMVLPIRQRTRGPWSSCTTRPW